MIGCHLLHFCCCLILLSLSYVQIVGIIRTIQFVGKREDNLLQTSIFLHHLLMVRVALSFVPCLNSFAHHQINTELSSLL